MADFHGHRHLEFLIRFLIGPIFQDAILDLENNRVYCSRNNSLTSVHCKPTDSHSHLLYSSSHPSHVKNSIPYSQFLRLRRHFKSLLTRKQARWPHFLLPFLNGHIMNVNYAKFQKRLIVEQFQGKYLNCSNGYHLKAWLPKDLHFPLS